MVIHWGGRGPGHSSRWPKAAAASGGAPPGDWLLTGGIWADTGIWDDADIWQDGSTAWLLSGGLWADAGVWTDSEVWED